MSKGSNVTQTTLIGAGIVNLIIAKQLVDADHSVRLIERSPDPRTNPAPQTLGCTYSGGNARMYTVTEMDYYDPNATNSRANVFSTPHGEKGWDIRDSSSEQEYENQWIRNSERAKINQRVIKEKIYDFGMRSKYLWDQWKNDEIELFNSSGLSEGILRLYNSENKYISDINRHNKLGVLHSVISQDQLSNLAPGLLLSGSPLTTPYGILVDGFTVNIHDFTSSILNYLESKNCKLYWNNSVNAVRKDTNRIHFEIHSSTGVFKSRNVIGSVGAYGNSLLGGTVCENRIHGVLGGWLEIPNHGPHFSHSMKVSCIGHQNEDTNVTLLNLPNGQQNLIFGSGYGYTGINPNNISLTEIDRMRKAIEKTAMSLIKDFSSLPSSFWHSLKFKYCVRPWTANSLGIFETISECSYGKYIVVGGHNTGGFAQAPVIAEAVKAALDGKNHVMHQAYKIHNGAHHVTSTAA